MLNPAPPRVAAPIITSSMLPATSAGSGSSAAPMARAARSSPRIPASDPLPARPIGVRAMETMTASSVTTLLRSLSPRRDDALTGATR